MQCDKNEFRITIMEGKLNFDNYEIIKKINSIQSENLLI